jgi:hypothetical protein
MTSEGHAAARLSRIAAAIGCPVETFYLPDSARNADPTFELLRLWGAITEPQARQRVLRRARQEIGAASMAVKAAE